MDDTQGSRLSDAAAAATRKRRSSILKSQRPPRTPFSELEFNVATPTDTAKSRRVSFSRRTGVAEFITNEATTTWKTFYEEQNKSMESSGNDSAMNPSRQNIGHLGKRIFDQQFQEVEAVDYGGNIMPSSNPRVQEMNMSMNINFTQQIAALECEEDDRKLAAPQQNFELSSFTDHRSKLFGDGHTIPTIGDMSNKININFSAIQPVGSNNDKCDDLDEIERDLGRSQSNVVCQGPFQGRNNSEYIEVDLNMTHVGMNNEDSDISITNTIHSPKVQEVSQSYKSVKNGIKSNVNKDWTLDKENIAINPYVAPKESSNFAINEVSDQVLVFDGRKLTIQPENNDIFNKGNEEQHFRKTLLPNNSSERPTQRKTIVLNVNDDLPNFIDNVSLLGRVHGLVYSRDVTDQKNSINNQAENRITSTLIYDNDKIANISVTQALPTDIILEKQKEKNEKRETIVFENDNGYLSMTQLVATNFDVCTKEMSYNKTVVYDGDNISFTQVLPSNMLLSEKIQTFCQSSALPTQNDFDISFTQAVPDNMLLSNKFTQPNKRNTILYGDDTGDISITRVLPTNILMVENRNDNNSVAITTVDQSLEKNKSKNTIYEKDSCNMSVTEAIPKNIIISNITTADNTKATYYDKDQSNISETQVIPTTMVDFEKVIKNDVKQLEDNQSFNKSTFMHNEKHITNMSMTEAVSENILMANNSSLQKRKTLNNASNVCDISVTQTLPSNIIISDQEKYCNQKFAKEKSAEIKNTIVENDNDFSLIQTVPENIILQNDILGSNTNEATRETESGNILHLNSLALNISNAERTEPTELISFENNLIETTHKGKPKDSFMPDSYKTHLDMSLTQLLHQNDVSLKANIISDKRKTIVYDDDLNNISVTQVIPTNILLNETEFKSSNVTQTDDGRNNEVLKNEFTESANMVTEYTQQNQHNISSCKAAINPHSNMSMYKEKAHNSTHQDGIVTNQLYNHSFVSITKQDILELSEVISEKSEIESDGNNMGNDSINKSSAPLLVQKKISQASNNAIERFSYIEQNFETKINKSATEHNHQDVFVYQAVTTHNVSRQQNMEVERNDSKMDKTLGEGVERPPRIFNNPNQSDDNLLNISKPQFTELENKEMSLGMSVNAVSKYDTLHKTEKPRNSILNELLNMSSKSLNESADGIDDKNLMVKMKSQLDQIPEYCHNTPETDLKMSELLECKENKPEDYSLKENVLDIKNLIYEPEQQNTQTKRHFEKVLSSNLEQVNFKENKNRTINESMNEIDNKKLQNSYRNKTFKTANDTNELLEMLSDFTDKKIAKETKEDEDKPSLVNVKNDIALEDRTDSNEFKRMSLAKSRMSIMLSQEDLLNNISMAHAALQQARIDMDESESIDDTHCDTLEEQSDEIMDDANTARKLVRVSTEVVKTLQFDDSVNEIKSKSDINLSPLKKTPFNDTANLIESKAKVIPSYLSEVSDGIKSLMHDLVKPMADVMPFETSRVGEVIKNDPSTCSIQIQANIITSSQIDINIESYPDSECDLAITQANKRFDDNFKHSDPTVAGSSAESLKSMPSAGNNKQTHIQHLQKQRVPEQILVFDHTNPLNNVVLSPAGKTNIHKYSPSKSSELIYEVRTDKSPQNTTIGNSVGEEFRGRRISTHYNIITSAADDRKPEITGSGLQSGDLSHERVENITAVLMNSKPVSPGNCTNDLETHIKDTEVNTLIAMKDNKELLEASSSLTLVEDDEQNVIDITNDICTTKSDLKNEQNSPVKIIFKINDQVIETFPSSVDLGDAENNTKAKKRIYSPAKRDQLKKITLLSPEVTPKPLSKMQKLSNSPSRLKNASNRSSTAKLSKAEIENASKDKKSINNSTTKKQNKSPQISISSSKPKLEATVIVQRVTMECKMDAESNVKARKTIEDMDSKSSSSSTLKTETVSQKEIKECLSPEMAYSFTSSKAMKEILVTSVTTTISEKAKSISSDKSRPSWQTEDINELGSKKLVLECESSENVLPKINMIPSIRSGECEWEYSDLYTWQFRLLRRRLRLTLKLGQVQSNTQAYICAETPVLSTTVDVAHEDADALSTTCVRLACEAMRYECGRSAARAGDVGALLRRCAGVARVARRWAATMRHAHLHLAYTLTHDGTLSLHVANIPLRCVWEVTMRLELMIEDARQAAWTHAGHVHVRDVTHGHDVTKASDVTCVKDVQRVLARVPHDWGHVPRTVWKVFKYLKNKTRDDKLLGI